MKSPSSYGSNTLAIIMGGGAGTRLFPLTKDRSKPAVPLAGKYRLVDIPISNCINSGLRHMYVLTQFNSTSLIRHIQAAYKFDHFSQTFVEVLAAQQRPSGSHWYQGTADAVRQNLADFLQRDYEYYLILSGDQLYSLDFRDVLDQHIAKGNDLTIATIPVSRAAASDFGIMHTDPDRRIIEFVEKPKEDAVLDELRIPKPLLQELGKYEHEELFQASMGIYIFNRKTLIEALDNELVDFGKHVIPAAIKKSQVGAYIFQGYWEDIGTISAFFEANLHLTDTVPSYSFFDAHSPVYTHARFLPATKINGANIRQAIISDGCIITEATIERCVIGVRSYIDHGSTLKNVIMMGADFYDIQKAAEDGQTTRPGIGRHCHIENAIIDKNASIGDGVFISPAGKPEHFDGPNYYVRDGIIIVPKNAVIPSGTRI